MVAIDRIVIIGASLAGLRSAETLRSAGFDGSITVVGDEPHRPYDRPPLSKQVLTGEWEPSRTAIPGGVEGRLDVTWSLGTTAERLDLDRREVFLSGGQVLGYDGLVLACGAQARRLPGSEPLDGVTTLRTLDDAIALRSRLDAGVRRMVVVGAGFIGAEVAASCRTRGIEVTLVEPLPQPLARVLGETVGAVVANLHRDHGVDVRLGVGVDRIEGTDRVERVVLTDGTSVEADAVVVGIGVVPNVAWLEGSGLTLDDGIVCDETTLAAPGVVAAGDVARWPNRLFDEVMRVEHWEHALDMAAFAARRLLTDDDAAEPYTPVPWFWSDQYDRKIQMAGWARPDDDIAVVAGSLDDRRFCVLYGRDGRVVGALAMNMPAQVIRYRRAIAEGLTWHDAVTAAAEAAAPASTGESP